MVGTKHSTGSQDARYQRSMHSTARHSAAHKARLLLRLVLLGSLGQQAQHGGLHRLVNALRSLLLLPPLARGCSICSGPLEAHGGRLPRPHLAQQRGCGWRGVRAEHCGRGCWAGQQQQRRRGISSSRGPAAVAADRRRSGSAGRAPASAPLAMSSANTCSRSSSFPSASSLRPRSARPPPSPCPAASACRIRLPQPGGEGRRAVSRERVGRGEGRAAAAPCCLHLSLSVLPLFLASSRPHRAARCCGCRRRSRRAGGRRGAASPAPPACAFCG